MRRALLVLAVFASCGPPDDQELPYHDHDLGVLREGLLVGQAGGCDTSIVAPLTKQLVAELNCIAPNTMVDFSAPNIMTSTATQPYLNPDAASALHDAVNGSGMVISLDSAYRSVAQQYLLYNWWQAGQCGIQIAAKPGSSNHQSGRAIDVPDYNTWKPALTAHGWTWYGSGDVVHFDFLTAPDISSKSVLAFQRLWNKNNPSNQIAEDGQWGPQTAGVMDQTPTTGFPIYGCTMMVTTGTLKGRVFDSESMAAIPGAVVTVGTNTPAIDTNGNFTVDLPPGPYTVTATAPGHNDGSAMTMVVANQTANVSLALDVVGSPDAGTGMPDAGSVNTTGPVVQLAMPSAGSSVSAAQVTLVGTVSDMASAVSSLTLALNGGMPSSLQLSGAGFSQTVHLNPGPNTLHFVATDAAANVGTADFNLVFRTGVDGLVQDPSGKPLGGILVRLDDSALQSADDGTFHFNVPPGNYTLKAMQFERPVTIGSEVRGSVTITGEPAMAPPPAGCGCDTGPAGLLPFLAALAALARRRR
jgi:MYXO-CTERM domain-containing protein